MKNIESERSFQQKIHSQLSDPSVVRTTESGKRLQILSPGRLNVHEGPDFLEVAILLDGMVIVGDAEFHRRTSEWKQHNHSADARYKSVILHITFINDDKINDQEFEILLIDENSLLQNLIIVEDKLPAAGLQTLEELQHYALLRLLRKTSEAQKLLKTNDLDLSLKKLVSGFISKYNSRRRRPVYTHDKLFNLIQNINSSRIRNFLDELVKGDEIMIPDIIHTMIKTKILDEGSHLRREILLNCILPIALCLANEQSRIGLFLWFWSTPAISKYGILNRRFADLPQNFLWQQQGMLEYMREHGRKANIVKEAIKDFGFAEILSFYRVGKAPFNG